MNCNRAARLLSDYVSAEISARDVVAVEAHIANCAECARLLHEIRRTAGLLVLAPREPAPDEFMSKLEARLARVAPRPPTRAWVANISLLMRPRLLPVWGGAVGAAVLTALLWTSFLAGPDQSYESAPLVRNSVALRMTDHVRTQSIAVSATDPFQDLATTNLTLQATLEPQAE